MAAISFQIAGLAGQDDPSYLPGCVIRAFPELTGTNRFSNSGIGQIWRNEITRGDLSCKFCVAAMAELKDEFERMDIRKSVRTLSLIF